MSSTFREVLRFELAHQGRRIWYWLIFGALFGVAFLLARDSMLAEALHEDFFANSPFAIAKVTVIGGLLWLVTAGAVAGEAAARDASTGMDPLVYTAPLARPAYLGGRFLAAFLLNAFLLLTLQAGALLALYGTGVDAASLGPFRPAAFLTNYAVLSLPNAFFVTAIQFLLASRSGRPMSAYVASFGLIFFGFFVAALLLFNRGVGKLLDPIGIRFVLDDMSSEWTSYEKSWRLVGLDGVVLQNRLVWVGIGVAALAAVYAGFRFAHRAEGARWWRRWRRRQDPGGARPPSSAPGAVPAAAASIEVPRVARGFGLLTHMRRAASIAGASFRSVAGSWPGRVFLIGIPLLTILLVVDQMSRFSVRHVPTTPLVLRELTGPLTDELSRWAFVPFLIVYFAGELVWRERDAGLGEVTDATPGSGWVPLLGKALGLALLLAAFAAATMAAGIAAQAILGHREFEIGLYVRALLGFQLAEYLLLVPVALAAHALANQKYVGHLLGILVYAVIVLAPMFGLEHRMLIYGAGPSWSYTAMRGFGPSVEPWLWFKLYWAGWALVLAVVARLLWVRGLESRFAHRLRAARRRLAPASAGVAALALAMVVTFGGFVFYNTNVLHDYRSSEGIVELRAEYERRYRRYAGAPQPALSAASLRVELHPNLGAADIRGAYLLENDTDRSIDTLHVALVHGQQDMPITFDRGATLFPVQDGLPHRIYLLPEPLRPGETLRMDFRARIAQRGFAEGGRQASVSGDASFFNASHWLPHLGYDAHRELTSPGERRRFGLPEKPLIPSLADADAPWDRGRGPTLATIVGTSGDQVAVAPGALEERWTENGRRYFRFATDAPIGADWVIASADYAVREERWESPDRSAPHVDIRVYHHPGHTSGIDRILHGIRASLDYYSREYGPYRYGHLTFVERPGNGTGMHADPSMVSFLEGAALLSPDHDPERFDLPFAVVAHEVGHQWHPPPALVEGAPVLTEGVASYYALRVVQETFGEQVHRQLRFMRLPYPYRPIRRGEPLMRGVDPYMAYRRGPFALRAVEEYVGGDEVNTALRRVLEKHRAPEAPLATMLDLYRELQAVTPDSLQALLHDLFEVNTFWDLKTERATAEEMADGTWRVTIPVNAEKVVVDERGEEEEVALDAWVDIGVFGVPPSRNEALGNPLYVRRHRIRSGEQAITVTVRERPVLSGVDPYHVLDWEEKEDDDNVEEMRYVGGTGEG